MTNRFNLETSKLASLTNEYFLNTTALETEMEKNTGIKLTSPNFLNIENKLLLQHVPFFEVRDSNKINKVTDKYDSINSPCSMIVNSIDELSEQMFKVYEISYYHYVLGKKNYPNFPQLCCGESTKNVVLSLLDAGFPNAAYVISGIDHAYAVLPFVFEKEKVKGTLIVDPTYDQLEFSNNMRNAVFIKLGENWEYKDPLTNKDLSPKVVCSIDSIKKSALYDIRGHHDGKNFFKKAFENPVKIEIQSRTIN